MSMCVQVATPLQMNRRKTAVRKFVSRAPITSIFHLTQLIVDEPLKVATLVQGLEGGGSGSRVTG